MSRKTPPTSGFFSDVPACAPWQNDINKDYWQDEVARAVACLDSIDFSEAQQVSADHRALELAIHLRKMRTRTGGIDALVQEYDLSSEEGVILMCLAEALLRIPDADTQSELISEHIGNTDWSQHPVNSSSLLVHASVWGLMLAGKVVRVPEAKSAFSEMLNRLGAPVVRSSVRSAMQILGKQFVMGKNIGEALKRADQNNQYHYNFDMLGEAACTQDDAEHYYQSYTDAIHALGELQKKHPQDVYRAPSISVKLSALHPRYEPAQYQRVHAELLPRLMDLAGLAKDAGIGLCMDAEEAYRLDLSLQLFQQLCTDSALSGWDGLGIAVQAYQKRAPALIDWLAEIAQTSKRRLQVRLVKGAYWDYEIKYAQQHGLSGYPVYTRKENTDISYVACAQKLLSRPDVFFPCFATHNARTLATIEQMGGDTEYEFQRLLGMGEALYDRVLESSAVPCRIYAPVGDHKTLLAYLVRRLLENGANSSFINRLAHDTIDIELVVKDAVREARTKKPHAHPQIPLPRELFGEERSNSEGLEFGDPQTLTQWRDATEPTSASPSYDGGGDEHTITCPADTKLELGVIREANADFVENALQQAYTAQPQWNQQPVEQRANALLLAADTLQQERAAFLQLLVTEAGRVLPDAVDELREAEDFLRYYAHQGKKLFGKAQRLPSPAGERDWLGLRGRGVFLCIAPWNFPLAIFIGQVAAALVAGNSVLAKPAEQTPLIAAKIIELLHRCDVPTECLHLLCGDGARIGGQLLGDARLGGVAFTGSTHTAHLINRKLAESTGPIIPFIAETGGINAMLVDSTALPEQVTHDVLASAFRSAGQRCSSLRLLCIQEEVFDEQVDMIVKAMQELQLGDPRLLSTDIGPVIDQEALQMLNDYAQQMDQSAQLLQGNALADELQKNGWFFAPRLYRVQSVAELKEERFGPVLHVLSYQRDQLPALCEQINALGYGLTLSVHSRIRSRIDTVQRLVRVGNFYVNRNQIGAAVGVQPFGGEQLSGTGPKAGGPNYLLRFASEYTISDNITALGGDPELLALEEFAPDESPKH